MLTAQISNGQVGLINPTDYWSTARSGGRDGLGTPIAHAMGLGAGENETKPRVWPWVAGGLATLGVIAWLSWR